MRSVRYHPTTTTSTSNMYIFSSIYIYIMATCEKRQTFEEKELAILRQAVDKAEEFRQARIAHWDALARGSGPLLRMSGYYHKRLTQIYQFLVPPGQRVIELGCSQGDLLAALGPATGVGVDFSSEMLRIARQRHPDMRFVENDVHELQLDEQFDVVILSDLVNDLWDVQEVFVSIAALSNSDTRVIINCYSRLWELPLAATEKLGLARPLLNQNWLTVDDVTNLLCLADFQVIRHWSEVLLPLDIPLLEPLFN